MIMKMIKSTTKSSNLKVITKIMKSTISSFRISKSATNV